MRNGQEHLNSNMDTLAVMDLHISASGLYHKRLFMPANTLHSPGYTIHSNTPLCKLMVTQLGTVGNIIDVCSVPLFSSTCV